MQARTKKIVLIWLLGFNLLLVAAYLFTNHVYVFPSHTVRRWFDLDAEANIPTWYASVQLFALFALAIFSAQRIEAKPLRRFYYLLGFVFLFFSADESAMIHEGITAIFFHLSIRSFFPDAHGMWVLVYPVLLLGCAVGFRHGLSAFWREREGRALFLTGAAIFCVGGVGFEIFGYYLPSFTTAAPVLHIMEVTGEESLELAGQSLMIVAFLAKFPHRRTAAASDSERLQEAA